MKIPKHIGLILDGNRRWARERDLPEIEGHKKGVEQIRPVVQRCVDHGVEHVTFWAFSTENWQRSDEFVSGIMELFRQTLDRKDLFDELTKNGAEFHILGDLHKFPRDIRMGIKAYLARSRPNPKKIDVNFALNYGGRDEILRAVREIIRAGVTADEVDDAMISEHLDTAGQADPDMIIRTGGEKRMSGFMAWQGVYAEYLFVDDYWPDFDAAKLDAAIEEFNRRDRRFGGDSDNG